MTNLSEKSISSLELPAVLRLLSEEAVSEEAKETALSLRPLTEFDDIRRRLTETTAARTMMDLHGTPSFREVRPVSASLRRAEQGGMLNTRELLDIAGVLRAARSVKEYGSGDRKEKSAIDFLFDALRANRFLEDKIFSSIVSEEEIADAASGELASIRRHIRLTGGKVREILQKITSSPHYAKYLQDTIITMRSDRYVVPVKAEYKSQVPGLTHDVSASGATLFIEPMGVVQANNELRELAAREKREIERILMELSADAADHMEDILDNYTMLVTLDGIFARAKLSYKLEASEPKISERGKTMLRRARHPLLDPRTAVPIDLWLGDAFDTLVITGPNTGGKTVTLKTLGLLTMMAQCGLHIPVDDDSHIAIYRQVLADIGDEQSIEQSLSTFSAHMTNIIAILKEADDNTLILFDELGAGTDPIEGAALAVSIIEHARSLGAKVVATTHYAELKAFAMTAPGVENASCEFDVETLRPTYRLLIGIPGKSNAFAISARLGLPEVIIDRAREQMNRDSLQLEDMLTQLERQRQEMERENLAARQLHLQMETDAKTAREWAAQLEKEREKATERARAEALVIIAAAREAADETFRELSHLRRHQAKEADWQTLNQRRSDLGRRLNEAKSQAEARGDGVASPLPETPDRPIQTGDTVELRNVGTKATVVSIEKDGSLQLQAGILNITAKSDEVRLIGGPKKAKPEHTTVIRADGGGLRAAAARELDLRGMMTDEAVAVLEQFLDNALMGKLETVTIIHGKGTGALRAAVHQSLRSSRIVKGFRLGQFGEGEAGVTIVTL